MSPEEKKRRQEKVEVIKKMLSEAPLNQSSVSIFIFVLFFVSNLFIIAFISSRRSGCTQPAAQPDQR